jgi:hypothetical protein
MDPDPSITKQKYSSKKTLIPTALWLLFDQGFGSALI